MQRVGSLPAQVPRIGPPCIIHNLSRVGTSSALRVKPIIERSKLWVTHVSEKNTELWLEDLVGADILDSSFAGSISAKLIRGCMLPGKPSVHLREADRQYFINETQPLF